MTDDELLDRWEKEDLKPTTHLLGQAQQELTARGFEYFGAAINLLLNGVFRAFAEKAGCTVAETVNHSAHATAICRTVSAFNGVLPLDHPYIVVVYGPKGVQARIAIMRRSSLPELQGNLRQDVVPVVVNVVTDPPDEPKKPRIDYGKFSDN